MTEKLLTETLNLNRNKQTFLNINTRYFSIEQTLLYEWEMANLERKGFGSNGDDLQFGLALRTD